MTRVEYHQATPRRSCAWREHRVERKRESTVTISLNKKRKPDRTRFIRFICKLSEKSNS